MNPANGSSVAPAGGIDSRSARPRAFLRRDPGASWRELLGQARRDRRGDGPERFGQVDFAPLSGGHPRPGLRRGLLRRRAPRHDARRGAQPAAARAVRIRFPVRPARPGAHRRGERRIAAPPRWNPPRGGLAVRADPGSSDSNSTAWNGIAPARCPADRRSGSRWRAVSSPIPTCCSPTSRLARSTRSPASS